MILVPDDAEAPPIVPVFVPNVQAKELDALAVRLMPGLVPLQVIAVVAVVTAGVGFTVTVISVADPAQLPVEEVGVT